MKFQRITKKTLPDGSVSTVYPFHVCSEGHIDRVLCRDEEDFRVAFNFIPICARRSNVIVVSDCVLSSHMHSGLLARCYEDAVCFGNSYKQSYSKYYTNRYDENCSIYQRVDTRPVYIEDDNYLRNVLCYIPRNALDMGIAVDQYEWSSYRSMFSCGRSERKCFPISSLTTRQTRDMFKTGDCLGDTNWLISGSGIIEPVSYCDWRYAEAAFYDDPKFFLRKLGTTDDELMEQLMVKDQQRMKPLDELIKLAEERSRNRFSKSLSQLSFTQKIPLVKAMYYSIHTSPKQLARCFGVEKDQIDWILFRSKEMRRMD